MKLLLFSCLFVISNLAIGQDFITKDQLDNRSKKLFEQAQRFVNSQNWSEATLSLDQIIARHPNAIDALLFRAGIHYDNNDLSSAEIDFKSALALSTTYALIANYQLGVTQYKLEKYTDAIANFEAFLSNIAPDDRRKARTEYYLDKAKTGAKIKANPVSFKPTSLGPNINTKGKEYLPSFTADGQLLVYTVNYNGQEDFYFSTKNEQGDWNKGQPFEEVNTTANEGAQSISADGRTLVFTGCRRKDGLGSCDLYYTEQKNGQWDDVIHPDSPLNTRYWESQPSLSSNGQWLFFASDRPGGLGENDIWVCQRKSDGQWGNPINLGAPINTPGNDESPFIHPDGQTLYFMSDGHPGLGGYDLFLARLENGQYSPPQNLGYPINTSASEGALTVSLDGKTAYYTTNTHTIAGQKQDFDIYQFPLHSDARPQAVTYVSGTIIDATTDKPIPTADVQIKTDNGQVALSSVKTDINGQFLIVLPAGKNYQFLASEDNYLFFSDRFELKNATSLDDPFLLNIKLQPVDSPPISGQEIVLKNVFFDSNSDELLNSSSQELNQLATLLKENPSMNIRINGHTDNIGLPKDNLQLSLRRAESVKQFLIETGIEASRLDTKGFGESSPIADNSTKDGQAQNRRTSFEVKSDSSN